MHKRTSIKKAGFTLVELIVVVIILGILAAMVVPKLFGNVSDAQVKKEAAFLNAVEKAWTTVLGKRVGELYAIDANVIDEVKNALQRTPRNFNYYLGMSSADLGDGAITATWVYAKADNTNAQNVNKMKKIVADLDNIFDNGDGSSAGGFRYNISCTASNDCYYVYYIADGGIKESQQWFDAAFIATDGSIDGTATYQADLNNDGTADTISNTNGVLF